MYSTNIHPLVRKSLSSDMLPYKLLYLEMFFFFIDYKYKRDDFLGSSKAIEGPVTANKAHVKQQTSLIQHLMQHNGRDLHGNSYRIIVSLLCSFKNKACPTDIISQHFNE